MLALVLLVELTRLSASIYYQHEPARVSACPVTIHALLHIADAIEMSGPVWTSWAFPNPMERYCGSLQPAIRSRRFPYASIDRHVIDMARLAHIKIIYNAHDALCLAPPKQMRGIIVPDCGYSLSLACCQPAQIRVSHVSTDPTCSLQPPSRRTNTTSLESGLLQKVVAHLQTRFNITAAAARRALPAEIDQWGKVQVLNDGDLIHASSMVRLRVDSRNMSYVRVRDGIVEVVP